MFSNYGKFGLSIIRNLVGKGVRCRAPAGPVFVFCTGIEAIVALATQICLAMVSSALVVALTAIAVSGMALAPNSLV